MATLTVLKFPTADGAEKMISILDDLQKQELIKIQDAAIVSWKEGKKKPKTNQLYDLKKLGALDGAFWGMLFGIIFFVPIFGMAIGAAMGALSGSFKDIGINDDFIEKIRTQVTEGTSALFLLSTDAVKDRVEEAIKDIKFEILATNLPKEEEEKLREMFVH
ncbi:DUF1269 domain-containing protein [Hydrocoleum sp. CS-953]|uniref:DUF1269 domain-containing protein n=1 Tax=Microcoleaceae TaxID=1892252 RepID=UPI000B9C722F|nr:DUF1269 domain-containing protein [Hydrocoleum sp. CS-953]OZH52055.1 membrane protein [Hydrocoleum sp. CS-953]